MDVDEHGRLSNVTLKHKFKLKKDSALIAVVHFTATVYILVFACFYLFICFYFVVVFVILFLWNISMRVSRST